VLAEAGKERKADADGDGPVDATSGIERVPRARRTAALFAHAVTRERVEGEVTVRLAKGGRIVTA